jgi:hypothetical protein
LKRDELKPHKVLRGPLFPEPVEALICARIDGSIKLTGRGLNTDKVYALIPSNAHLSKPSDLQPFESLKGFDRFYSTLRTKGDTMFPRSGFAVAFSRELCGAIQTF